jgi:hypothetical protein
MVPVNPAKVKREEGIGRPIDRVIHHNYQTPILITPAGCYILI